MQSEPIKKRIIKSLIDEIVSIDAASLELFGHRLIELIEEKRLIHHGLNADHRPVGYTVDTFSQSGDVIGEYCAVSQEQREGEAGESTSCVRNHLCTSTGRCRTLERVLSTSGHEGVPRRRHAC